jgi:pilus assembly protein CpaB
MTHVAIPRPSRGFRLPRLDLTGSGGLEGRLPIAIGVALALLAAVLVYVAQQHAREEANAPQEVVPVVVAGSNIAQGTLLNSSNISTLFTVKRLPSNGVPQDAVPSLSVLDGQVTATNIAAGDRVVASMISAPADSTVSGARAALLPPGQVAIILPVNDNISVGGAVVPTDRVDVIASIPVTTTGENGKSSDTLVTQAILRDVRVLATGFRTRPPAVNGQTQPADTNPTPYSTLTLALSPEDAITIQHLLAQNVRLALALRRPGEQTVPTTPVTSSDIARRLGLTGQAVPSPAQTQPQAPAQAQAPASPKVASDAAPTRSSP